MAENSAGVPSTSTTLPNDDYEACEYCEINQRPRMYGLVDCGHVLCYRCALVFARYSERCPLCREYMLYLVPSRTYTKLSDAMNDIKVKHWIFNRNSYDEPVDDEAYYKEFDNLTGDYLYLCKLNRFYKEEVKPYPKIPSQCKHFDPDDREWFEKMHKVLKRGCLFEETINILITRKLLQSIEVVDKLHDNILVGRTPLAKFALFNLNTIHVWVKVMVFLIEMTIGHLKEHLEIEYTFSTPELEYLDKAALTRLEEVATERRSRTLVALQLIYKSYDEAVQVKDSEDKKFLAIRKRVKKKAKRFSQNKTSEADCKQQ